MPNTNNTDRIYDPRDIPPKEKWDLPIDMAMVSIIEKISDKMTDLKIRLKELEGVEEENKNLSQELINTSENAQNAVKALNFLAKHILKDPTRLSWYINEMDLKSDVQGERLLALFKANESPPF
jgi:hypothetical protein